jgi:hypothetical protein
VRRLIDFMTLLAVLLMPLGMTAAPAAAMHHHEMSMQMQMQHCPEQGKPAGKAAFIECTMACSAALPATDLRQGEPLLIICSPVEAQAVRQLHGLHPETATPPPKRT